MTMADLSNHSAWLADLKVGDAVAILSSGGNSYLSEGKVERVTATLLVVGCTKYHRKDGRRVSDRYGPRLINPESKAAIDLSREQGERAVVNRIAAMSRHDWSKMPIESLHKVIAIIDAAKTEPAT